MGIERTAIQSAYYRSGWEGGLTNNNRADKWVVQDPTCSDVSDADATMAVANCS